MLHSHKSTLNVSRASLGAVGAGGIRGSSRGHPVHSFHPRLRAPGTYVPTGRLPIGRIYRTASRRCNVIHVPHSRSRLTPWHYPRSAPFRIPPAPPGPLHIIQVDTSTWPSPCYIFTKTRSMFRVHILASSEQGGFALQPSTSCLGFPGRDFC